MNDMFDSGNNNNKHSSSINKDTLVLKKQVKYLKQELKKRDDYIKLLSNDNEQITS
jgi:hypothetical protein